MARTKIVGNLKCSSRATHKPHDWRGFADDSDPVELMHCEGHDAKECKNCGTPESEKPLCFRGEPWCSDNCKKALTVNA